MEIETIDRRTISQADARAIAELLEAIWPKPGRTVETRTAELLNYWRDYRGPEAEFPRSFVVREAGRVIAHAGVHPQAIGTPHGDMTILALGRVCTDLAVRGRKLGDAIVRTVFDLVDNGPFPFSLFQTSTNVRPFYERFGAVEIHNRFINSLAADPTVNPFWEVVTMRYADGPGWPSGEIDLRGPGW
jgi:predicted N-acetyltransferase YhbS